MSGDLGQATPFATTKANRTYPVLEYRRYGDKSIIVFDPIAFKDVPAGRVLFAYSDDFAPYQPRATEIGPLRQIAQAQASKYRGAA